MREQQFKLGFNQDNFLNVDIPGTKTGFGKIHEWKKGFDYGINKEMVLN